MTGPAGDRSCVCGFGPVSFSSRQASLRFGSIEDMPVLKICLIVSAVLIFSFANVVVIKQYFRGGEIREKSVPTVYQPVEQDKMGHLYY